MSKRVVYRVRFNRKFDYLPWEVCRGPKTNVLDAFDTKKEAVELGAWCAREEYENEGTLTQLVVHNKRGRISFERTYGNDPRRTKG